MVKERLTLSEIQTRLIGKSAGQLFGYFEDKDGTIILGQGLSLDALGMAIDSSGTLQLKNAAEGQQRVALEDLVYDYNTPADSTDAAMAVPTGATREYEFIVCEFIADATVIVRTCVFRYVPVPLGVVVNSTVVETTAFNLSASQDAVLILPGKPYHWQNLNGTITIVADENPLPVVAKASESFSAVIKTNKQAGDRTTIRGWYRKVA